MLTATLTSPGHFAAAWQAWPSTQWLIGVISPVLSASGMKRDGLIAPSYGWVLLNSASQLRMRPVFRSTIGW
ncbi:MAG: hypothetical protein QOH04_816 [Sphingomonadales bacterium]|jgi:hypothetical protein|nr:hypothetical protein [Sphingomonadales bacterium]